MPDFDAALRDPEIPTQMRAADDCGDGLHPSDSGCPMNRVDAWRMIAGARLTGYGEITSHPRAILSQSRLRLAKNS